MSEYGIPRYLVLDMNPDATGYGQDGKGADTKVYAFDNEQDADYVAKRINDYRQYQAENFGGYPGAAWVLDLGDPDAFDDPRDILDVVEEVLGEEEVVG